MLLTMGYGKKRNELSWSGDSVRFGFSFIQNIFGPKLCTNGLYNCFNPNSTAGDTLDIAWIWHGFPCVRKFYLSIIHITDATE